MTDDGVLTRCSLSKPLPRRKDAVDIFLKLQRPCECDGTTKTCPHYLYALSPRKRDTPSTTPSGTRDPTVVVAAAQADGDPIPIAFEDFDVHRKHRKLVVPQTLVTSVLYHIHGSGERQGPSQGPADCSGGRV